jgi:HEAT repeat protein
MDPLVQNALHIVQHRGKTPLPSRTLDDVTPAYGLQKMVKLTRLLGHDDTMTRDRALVALHSSLQKPQLRACGVQAGIVPALRANLSDPSLMVRAHTATAFNMLAGHPLGVSAAVAGGAIPEMIKLLDDTEDAVRVAAYQALVTVAKSVAGSSTDSGWSGNTDEEGGGGGGGALTDCPGFTSSIVAKCKSEPEHLQPFALDLFGALLKHTKAVNQALLSVPPAIETMTELLGSYNSSVREKAANNLAPLTFPTEAKNMAVAAGSIEKLVMLLKDSDFKIRASAASALGAICVDEAAREHAGGCPSRHFMKSV